MEPSKFLTQKDIELAYREALSYKRFLPVWDRELDEKEKERIELQLQDIMLSREIDELTEQGACACEVIKKRADSLFALYACPKRYYMCKRCSILAYTDDDAANDADNYNQLKKEEKIGGENP